MHTETVHHTAQAPAPVGHNRPPRKRRLFKHDCPECATPFTAARDAKFCSTPCKNTYHNRNMKRGKVAMPLLLAWRGARSLPKWMRERDAASGEKPPTERTELSAWAFRELCALADLWNEDDRKAGRLPATSYVLPKMRAGWKGVDLL